MTELQSLQERGFFIGEKYDYQDNTEELMPKDTRSIGEIKASQIMADEVLKSTSQETKCEHCRAEIGYHSLVGVVIRVDGLAWCDTVCHDDWIDANDKENMNVTNKVTNSIPWPDPSPEDLSSPEFEAIWQTIKTWDINVPEAYVGYCGASGNHAKAILDALKKIPNVGQIKAGPGSTEKSVRKMEENMSKTELAHHQALKERGFVPSAPGWYPGILKDEDGVRHFLVKDDLLEAYTDMSKTTTVLVSDVTWRQWLTIDS